jgi:hypothetical protein
MIRFRSVSLVALAASAALVLAGCSTASVSDEVVEAPFDYATQELVWAECY